MANLHTFAVTGLAYGVQQIEIGLVGVSCLLIGLTAESAGGSAEARGGLPILHWPCNAGRLRTLISNLLHVRPAAAPVPARRAS